MRKSYFETRRPLGPVVGLPRDLYADPDQRARADAHLAVLLDDPETLAAIQKDAIPVPATADREGYYDDRHLGYWLSGRADLLAIRKAGVPPEAFRSVLDLGGASGRVARHLALAQPTPDVTVAELNINHVDWIERHAGAGVRAVKLGPHPHLPLPDRSVTLAVAFSVFTHMDAYESGWLAELARVVAPGGYGFLTVHNEDTWAILQDAWVYRALKDHPEFARVYRPGEPMPGDHLVFEYNPDTIEYNCNIFFSSEYLRRRWGKWFDVAAIIPQAHAYQTGVLVRKRG